MTIEKGEPWGRPAPLPADGASCAATPRPGRSSAGPRRAGSPVPAARPARRRPVPHARAAGDEARLRSADAMTFPCRPRALPSTASATGSWPTSSPAVVVARASRRGHERPVARGTGTSAPARIPNDGLLDITDGDLPLGDRWQARRRLPTGTHLPHPASRSAGPRTADLDARPVARHLARRREGRAGRRLVLGPRRARRPPRRGLTGTGLPRMDLDDGQDPPDRRGRQAGRPAARRLAPDPRAPRAGLRGGLRPRAAHRHRSRTRASRSSAAPTASTPRSSARAGTEGPTIAVLCEYDALPGIGHACGHNIIAAAGLGAGLAAAALADELGGRVRRPGHAGRGGRRRQGPDDRAGRLRRRRRRDDGAPGRRRPAGHERHRHPADLGRRTTAQAAHAAAFPHKGRNALDAAVLGYMNVAALRQHIRPDERIHGIFTDGGDKPNIVPARAAAQWYVRAAHPARASSRSRPGCCACLQAGADAAGCTMTYDVEGPGLRRHARQRSRWSTSTPTTPARLGRTPARPDRRRPRWSAAPTWATSATWCRPSTR